jgi:maleate isomerase
MLAEADGLCEAVGEGTLREAHVIGWRARLGFLVPPGNPTVEPEVIAMAPEGVSVHFQRMVAHGTPGAHQGQEERNRTMLDHIDASVEMLALVKPDVIALAHTASSYALGRNDEAALVTRLESATGIPFVTAFGSVVRAIERLGITRLALGTPDSDETTRQSREHLEAYGFHVVCCDNLKNVVNIYDETAERAYRLARAIDAGNAEAVFLSGTGMPTVAVLAVLEEDLGKPVLSSNAAMLWQALRTAGVKAPISGYGRLLTLA